MVAYQSNCLLLEIDQATFVFGQANSIANDYESINSSSDFGQFSFICGCITDDVFPVLPLLDSNCCVKVTEILTELHRQSDPRSNQYVIVAESCNQHPYDSLTPLTKAEITPTCLFQHVDSAPKTTTRREYCSGLLDKQIENHAKVSPAYCNKACTKFKGAWRSNNCEYDAPDISDQQRSG